MSSLANTDLVEACREVVRGWHHPRVLAVYLYGSTVRGNSRPDSDVDVAILDSEERLSPADEARLMDSLERAIHQPVDLRMIRDCSLSHQVHIVQKGVLIWAGNEQAVEQYKKDLLSTHLKQPHPSHDWQNFLERFTEKVGAKR